MAREWEETPEADNLDYDDNPYISPGDNASRRYWAREAWLYRPEDLEEHDSRRGTDRRYMRGMNKYLRDELRLRNNTEGLV